MTEQSENVVSTTQEELEVNVLSDRVPPEGVHSPQQLQSSHRRTDTGDSVREREPGDPQPVVEPLVLDKWTGNEVFTLR